VVARWDHCTYKQWNAAFDAGLASAKGVPLITLHPPEFGHMLKEVNAAALASCRTPEQVLAALAYVTKGILQPRDGFTPFMKRPKKEA
jgi:YtoQ family protein